MDDIDNERLERIRQNLDEIMSDGLPELDFPELELC
jgi:hypothetical protein